jgi:methylmalonyl-CoA/ethylmalonyl-CoA epimerase
MTPFQELHHVCIAVEDIDRAMAFYESVGIGPWQDYPPLAGFTDLDVPDAEGFRKLIYKWTMAGDLQLQLCEPGHDGTPQRAFLDAHGPGVYHLGFVVDDADAGQREAETLGLRTSARGRRPNGSGFTYFDTRAQAGVTLENRQSPPGEEPRAAQPAWTPFGNPHHLCLAVADIERTAAFYESVGIGPWQRLTRMDDLTELEGPAPEAFHDLTYVWTTVGDLHLQLVQPGAGRTPQSDFLAAHGEGVFHMGFAVDSVDDAEAEAAERGLDVILRGRRADGTGFSYFDTHDAAAVTLQVRKAPAPAGVLA